MSLNIDEVLETAWYMPGGKLGEFNVKFKVKPIYQKEIRAILKKTTMTKRNREGVLIKIEDEEKREELMKELIVSKIVDWEGIVKEGPSGKMEKVECNDENKKEILEKLALFEVDDEGTLLIPGLVRFMMDLSNFVKGGGEENFTNGLS